MKSLTRSRVRVANLLLTYWRQEDQETVTERLKCKSIVHIELGQLAGTCPLLHVRKIALLR